MSKPYGVGKELSNCNDKALFTRIKFARIQAVSWDGQLGEMSEFFRVKDDIKGESGITHRVRRVLRYTFFYKHGVNFCEPHYA